MNECVNVVQSEATERPLMTRKEELAADLYNGVNWTGTGGILITQAGTRMK